MSLTERNLKVKAIVVNTKAFGEINKSVTLLTTSLGLIDAIIYGGRKGKKTALAPLFSFGTFSLYFNPVKNIYSLTDVDTEFTPENIFQNLNATYTTFFFSEVATKTSSDDYNATYQILSKALLFLDNNTLGYKKILIDFVWKIICICGIATNLNKCPSCEKRYDEKETLYFSSTLTVPVCFKCADIKDLTLSPGPRKYLQYTMKNDIEKSFSIQIFPSTEKKLYNFLIYWISFFCHNNLKTVKQLLYL